jgi:hypothetical protein
MQQQKMFEEQHLIKLEEQILARLGLTELRIGESGQIDASSEKEEFVIESFWTIKIMSHWASPHIIIGLKNNSNNTHCVWGTLIKTKTVNSSNSWQYRNAETVKNIKVETKIIAASFNSDWYNPLMEAFSTIRIPSTEYFCVFDGVDVKITYDALPISLSVSFLKGGYDEFTQLAYAIKLIATQILENTKDNKTSDVFDVLRNF